MLIFDRGGPLAELLVDSMSELNLYACDLSFHSMVNYTYERDDGLVQSWIGHIVCSQSFSSLVTDIYSHHSFWHQLVRSCVARDFQTSGFQRPRDFR